MADELSSPHRPSEPPEDDLKRERDDFLKSFFRKGAQLTEELVRERDAARLRTLALEEENALLRTQIERDKTLREFLVKIEKLEREKNEMVQRFREVEAQSSRIEASTLEIEGELANLANLYVASYQLHSSMSPRGGVRHIRELLANLVGAVSFAMFLLDPDTGKLRVAMCQGVEREQLQPIASGEGPVGDCLVTGLFTVSDSDPRKGSLEKPVALIPLRFDDRVLGVLAIFQTLEQKNAFIPVDRELFKLLGAQAMTALIAATYITEHKKEPPSLAHLFDLGA